MCNHDDGLMKLLSGQFQKSQYFLRCFADEPTGNLDSKTTQEVLGLLKLTGEQFHQTIVMITHNEALAQLCDRVIHIEDGKIIDDHKQGGVLHEK